VTHTWQRVSLYTALTLSGLGLGWTLHGQTTQPVPTQTVIITTPSPVPKPAWHSAEWHRASEEERQAAREAYLALWGSMENGCETDLTMSYAGAWPTEDVEHPVDWADMTLGDNPDVTYVFRPYKKGTCWDE